MIGCDPAMIEQGAWLTEFFTGSPRWNLEGSDLILSNADIEIELEERVQNCG